MVGFSAGRCTFVPPLVLTVAVRDFQVINWEVHLAGPESRTPGKAGTRAALSIDAEGLCRWIRSQAGTRHKVSSACNPKFRFHPLAVVVPMPA